MIFMNGYLVMVIIPLLLGLGASGLVKARMRKYSNVRVSMNLSGREAALKMLADNGITNVSIQRGHEGEDHFDPRTNSISLSPSNYDEPSLTACATACHEAGHAMQYAFNYHPLFLRASLVPVVNLCSNAWFFIFIIGIAMHMAGLTLLACAVYAVTVLFQIVTLPVEFNASSRALSYMRSIGIQGEELTRGKKLLSACALTYVVAALVSAIQLLWIFASQDR